MSLRRFPIPLGLLLGATMAASNCGVLSPVGVDGGAPDVLVSTSSPSKPGHGDATGAGGDSLLSCRPLPYDSATRTIGPAGGVLEVGHNWLLVPKGALREWVRITAVAPSDTVALIRLQPEGLHFEKPAFLVATYDHCRVRKGLTPRIAHVTDALDVIEYLPSVDASLGHLGLQKVHKWNRRVVGELQHFSNYAVAW